MDAVHWTLGVCSEDENSCLKQRYSMWNITQIAGTQMATVHPGSIDSVLLRSLTFPAVHSMNCNELCNCLSCGHGNCSDQEDQDKCTVNKSGFICRCSNSPSYPSSRVILMDMLSTGNACRQCKN